LPKILITGVGGFIGSNVARRFILEGWKVFGVDNFSSGKKNNIPAQVELISGNLAEKRTIRNMPQECKTILHLAGQSSGEISFDDPVEDMRSNTISTLNLIEHSILNHCEKIIYASSMSVYGAVPDKPVSEEHPNKPISCYGVGKQAAENYLRIFGSKIPWVSLRMFNVYGPGQDLENLRQGMVSIYVAQAIANGEILVKGDLNRFRDFIFIDDVVESWFRAATRAEAIGQTINVGTGVRTTVKDLAEKIQILLPGVTIRVQENTPGDQYGIYADIKKLKSLLGISVLTSLNDGLKKFLNWAQSKK